MTSRRWFFAGLATSKSNFKSVATVEPYATTETVYKHLERHLREHGLQIRVGDFAVITYLPNDS